MEALPFIQAGATIFGVGNQIYQQNQAQQQMQRAMKENPALTLDQAWQQAQTVLNPVYDKQIADVMRQSDKDLLARGFYGQLSGDALGQSRRLDALNAKQTAIASLANSMAGQSKDRALQYQQLAIQNALGQGNLANQTWQGVVGAAHGIDWVAIREALKNMGRTGESVGSTQWYDSSTKLPTALTGTGISSPNTYTLLY
jgi:hypothetical protein